MAQGHVLTVRDADCRSIHVFDVGREIDLPACRRIVADLVREPGRRAWSSSFSVEPVPLPLVLPTPPMEIEGCRVRPGAEVGIYEFGAVAVTFTIPVAGSVGDLRAASCRLAGNGRLEAAARAAVESLVARIGAAVKDLDLSDVVEEYLVFEVREFDADLPLAELPEAFAFEFAQVLRAESVALSAQEVAHATSTVVSHTTGDLALLDWNAALVFHPDPAPVIEVLELVNVQLVEMRYLDRRLDEALQQSYESLLRRNAWIQIALPWSLREAMQRLGRRQVESAILYERAGNALKLVGDQYLARVYRRAADRFGLETWHAAIREKLATIDSIYAKVHDRVASVRLEILEWIVIVLIASEMVIALLRP